MRLPRWLRTDSKGPADNAGRNGGSSRDRFRRNYANPIEDVHIWEFQSENPQTAAIQIVTPMSVYDVICQHAQRALPNETGGFLMGQAGRDIGRNRWHLYVDQVQAVDPVEAAPTHFTFTWRDVERVRTLRETTGKALIGWYHTHPDLGVFLSKTDVGKTHNRLFNDAFQIALVLDPVRGTAAYFCRDGDAVFEAPRGEFHLEFDAEATS
jgi:proteasome lid subunit RPN8/RPN11